MYTKNRIVFGSGKRGGHTLIPEILEAGWGHFSAADSGHLWPHAHADAFEVCFIISGEVEWGAGDASYILRAGDAYVTQPNEVHWGRDGAMHPCTLYWLIVGSLGRRFEWPGLDPELAVHLDIQLRRIRTHRIRGTPRLRAAFGEIFQEHKNSSFTGPDSILQRGSARAALHSLLIELVRVLDRINSLAPSTDPLGSCLPSVATQVIEILHHSPDDPDAVCRACAATGMDYKTLNQHFVEHLGTTISQYWLRERVRLARDRLLQKAVTITDVAAELGFSSSQHFATVFRKITGLTPGAYREAVRR